MSSRHWGLALALPALMVRRTTSPGLVPLDVDAAQLARWIEQAYPGSRVSVGTAIGGGPTVHAHMAYAPAVEVSAALAARAGCRMRSQSPDRCRVTTPAGEVEFDTDVPQHILVRLMARTMVELDERVGGKLIAIMGGREPLPDDLNMATNWASIDDEFTGSLDTLVVLAWVERAYWETPFGDPVALSPVEDLVHTLLRDLAAEAGLDLDERRGRAFAGAFEVLADLSEAAGRGDNLLAVARRVHEDQAHALDADPAQASRRAVSISRQTIVDSAGALSIGGL